MYKIHYSNEAESDLDNAISHIADESVENALNYLARYERKVELLSLNPFMGVECKNKLIQRDCRVLVNESHIIVYKVLEDKREIFLIRIFHTSVNYPTKLNTKS
ncbi:MAG: type II toxin-antitoxin system RelE/ParE family toxin [Campylobacterota bacterium]